MHGNWNANAIYDLIWYCIDVLKVLDQLTAVDIHMHDVGSILMELRLLDRNCKVPSYY
jgi:hypothetical protein